MSMPTPRQDHQDDIHARNIQIYDNFNTRYVNNAHSSKNTILATTTTSDNDDRNNNSTPFATVIDDAFTDNIDIIETVSLRGDSILKMTGPEKLISTAVGSYEALTSEKSMIPPIIFRSYRSLYSSDKKIRNFKTGRRKNELVTRPLLHHTRKNELIKRPPVGARYSTVEQ
ncbi:9683_t:CDS:2, partial [Ambispora gerdemannii]